MIFKNLLDRIPNGLQLTVLTVVVSIMYYISAKFGLVLSFKPDYIAALWPPNAVLLSALFMSKRKNWVWFLLAVVPAELAADLPAGIPLSMSLGFIVSDWVEVLSAVLLFRHFSSQYPDFSTIKQTLFYIGCCVILAPMIAAFPGAIVTGIGQAAGPDYFTRWFRWFISDGITHLLITPCIILWVCQPITRIIKAPVARYFEPILLSIMLFVTGSISLSDQIITLETFPALLYAPLPILLWASVRFGPRGVFTSSLFIAVICIWSGTHGSGPFTANTPAENVINLQFYLIITLTPLLFIAVLIKELKNILARLKNSESQFRALVDTSPMAISILQKNRFLYVNPAWEKLTGYTKEEASRLDPFMVVHPEMRNMVKKNATQRLNGKKIIERYEMKGITKNGDAIWYDSSVAVIKFENQQAILCLMPDITAQKKAELEKNRLIIELQNALYEIKTLRGIIPICAACKSIRDDKGYWNNVESYITEHSNAEFTHGMCPECSEKYYGKETWYKKISKKKF